MSVTPKIILVGAGPGDPDLITVKGLRALQQCQAVLYDALLDETLLEAAPAHAPRIFVGKRCGQHSFTQEQINKQLVTHARQYGSVVRLKGGDPFVFGRGQEELAYARTQGIEVEIIPGLSSATSVPGLAGIPVTSRGFSNSFWVITATTKQHRLSADIYLAAQSKATVVILMGTRKLAEIAAVFRAGRGADTLVAYLENGSRIDQRTVCGTLATIEQQAKSMRLGSPGIIVIGEVVSLQPNWQKQVRATLAESVLTPVE